MILILTSTEDATADYLATRLDAACIPFFRLNTDTSVCEVRVDYGSNGASLSISGRTVKSDDISNVWYRRPGDLKLPWEMEEGETRHVTGEWAAAIEGVLAHIPEQRWINHPANNAVASHKMEQLTRAKSLGFTIPDTIVTQSLDILRLFWQRCNREVIIKPLLSGYVDRASAEHDTIIYTSRLTVDHLSAATELLATCPTLFQRLVRKVADVRITVVDNEMHAVALFAKDASGQQRLDIRRNNMADVRYEVITLPGDVRGAISKLVRSYKLRFAAIDMAIQHDGQWVFFEVNPNGQWAWTDIAGGSDIASSFLKTLSMGEPRNG